MTQSLKPQIAEHTVRALLEEHFARPVAELSTIHSGQIAQTFSFAVDRQDYIIRFNTSRMAANFGKEAYIAEHFADPRVPIPRIVRVGRFEDLHFAISHKVPGVTLISLPPAEVEQFTPALIETLDVIHHVDIRGTAGYGTIDDGGAGMFPSWRQYLAVIREEEADWDFFGKWHVLFRDSFLERDLFDRLYDQMIELIDHCPEERYLVHGNYGFGNIIVHEGRITGVLDWIDAEYGDFVYDIAGLDLWAPHDTFRERFRQHYAAQDVVIPAYAERIRCYQCHISLNAMRFFAKQNNKAAYDWICDRILSLLNWE
jgi:hygromycin-B 4-O-kinase